MSAHTLESCGNGYTWSDRMAEHEGHYQADMPYPPLDSFAWPGGYPIIYMTEDGDMFCGRHAWAVIVREDVPMSREILWEGPAEWCAEGSHPIESAYGETEEDAA